MSLLKKILKTNIKKISIFLIIALLFSTVFSGCRYSKNTVIIYTSVEHYILEDLINRLYDEFPDYDVIVEYMSTGNQAAKLLAEGKNTDCDISYNLEYTYLAQLSEKNVLADLSDYDMSIYSEDTLESNNYIIQGRNGGAIIVNTDILKEKGLSEPTSYEDLLKPEYKGLIAMPNPKSSGTGYMFLKSLVNSWGEEEAFEYFDKLDNNILQYTSSGSGPVNALIQGEVAIGLGMTSDAVLKINEGSPLKIIYFEEGSPFSLYGQAMISGKETNPCVKEVFDFLINTYNYECNSQFYPEQIFKDAVCEVENYPTNIQYSDMSNNSVAEKERLLDKWKY